MCLLLKVAGCTLDAGAKIYASRVDSIYSDAYKVLGGIGKGDIHDEGMYVHVCTYITMHGNTV